MGRHRTPTEPNPAVPIPSPADLDAMGFVRCTTDGCPVWVEPANSLGRQPTDDDLRRLKCKTHTVAAARERRARRSESTSRGQGRDQHARAAA